MAPTKAGFWYDKNDLVVDGVKLSQIAADHGTPLYVYSAELLRRNYRRLVSFFPKIDLMVAYSTKANSNLAVLNVLAKEGAGFDIVSGGELERVRRVGVPSNRVIFAGVGKTETEMRAALKAGVLEFNLESEAEAERLNAVAGSMKKIAPVAIRVNPNVDAKTHKHITTGKKENKFGVSLDRAFVLGRRIVKDLKNLSLKGLHAHIGSQILDPNVHPQVVGIIMDFADRMMSELGIKFETLNMGGGFGIAYQEDQKPLDLKPFAKLLIPELKKRSLKLILEPGRSICAPAGVLLAKVEYIKPGDAKTFVILDSAMTELIRPTLYEAHHEIKPVTKKRAKEVKVDFVGPVCESGDYLAKDRITGEVAQGDLLAIMDAGAYGFVMASNYNTRCKPAEILVDGGKAHVVRKRETYADLLKSESIVE